MLARYHWDHAKPRASLQYLEQAAETLLHANAPKTLTACVCAAQAAVAGAGGDSKGAVRHAERGLAMVKQAGGRAASGVRCALGFNLSLALLSLDPELAPKAIEALHERDGDKPPRHTPSPSARPCRSPPHAAGGRGRGGG